MREDIVRFLSTTTEATANSIATGTGLPQLDVKKELNRMLGEAVVEREKRTGGGNEYVYWLAGRAPAPAPVNSAAEAEAEVTYAVEQRPLDVAQVALEHPPVLANFPCVARPVVPDGVVDAEIRMSDLLAVIKTLTAQRDAAVAKAETWRANAATLEARIDELTLGPVGARAPLFVTVGRYCKPKRHTSLEKAQRRGSALVRTEKESEVLVLEPVGRIVRGTQWLTR
ncbi:1-pyrroline-5-carboxylate dehydrogenase [Burkholderia sp. Ac-20344]|uniref:1-pyrroline-5-carboxylate dehydrogenase n=1 Tax=Burkholderia sp. Ac-20344 TaxID=2703890 RepID=UPI00197C4BB8|nr:1-pyrroline-5-carboxylate dehydrogenase [Burkholderia sp. Ac-20344]MBN3832917.1 1-pyrroline-5-carboxylate dehydrogenase [Burkholderia sp. Ac-20344]